MKDNMYQFVQSEYYATGEGVTRCFLITRAYPRVEDYVKPSYFDENGEWHYESDLRNTAAERALREFADIFGEFYAMGAEVVTQEEFFSEKTKQYIPPIIEKMVNEKDQPGNFNWYDCFHINYG